MPSIQVNSGSATPVNGKAGIPAPLSGKAVANASPVNGSAPGTPFTGTSIQIRINGELLPSSSGKTFDTCNPASKAVVTVSPAGTFEDCKKAIEGGQAAFKLWRQTPLGARRDIFLKAAELLSTPAYMGKAVEAMMEETDSSLIWAQSMVGATVEVLKSIGTTCIEQLRSDSEAHQSTTAPGAQVVIRRQPLGVILGISPWNAPAVLAVMTTCIPIVCGNAVLLKASEDSPRSQALVVDLLHDAGLPAGVLNFVTISREDTPAVVRDIIAHPLIRKICFTGSATVGRIMATEAAKYLKPCILEMGGKAPVIVLNDADLDNAAKAIVSGAFFNSGQICISTERVIVQKGVSKTLIKKIVDVAAQLSAGGTGQLRGLINERAAKRVVEILQQAREQGADVRVGDLTQEGTIVQPHVVVGVTQNMRLWKEETFGPVLAVVVAEDVDHAVELANDSDCSLAASLWTNDLYHAQDLPPRLRGSFVNINGSTFHIECSLNVAGVGGSSGYGRFDVNEFTFKQSVTTHPMGGPYVHAS